MNNSQQRSKASSFAASQPGPRLLVARVAMQPQVSFLHAVERIASEQWDQEQCKQLRDNGDRSYRVVECHTGSLATNFKQSNRELANLEEKWVIVRAADNKLATASTAWSMLTVAACSMEQLQFSLWQGYPYKVFTLILCPTFATAQRLLDDPPCLKDSWSLAFLKRFSTCSRLLSVAALSALLMLAWTLRIDISRQECRHAWVRRSQREKSMTYGADVSSVSADYVLMRARQTQALFNASGAPRQSATAKKQGRARERRRRKWGRCKGAPTGGGGAFRRAFGIALQRMMPRFVAKKARSEVFNEAHAEARRLRAAGDTEWRQIVEEGEAGTAANRAGGVLFPVSAAGPTPAPELGMGMHVLP